jgi:hypothetical protein
MSKRHEICTYPYGVSAGGDHHHIDNITHTVETGWSVHVREYTDGVDDEWDEVYDEDFPTEEERDTAIAALHVKYQNATEDRY